MNSSFENLSRPRLKTWRIKILKVSTESECCRGQYEQIVKRPGNCWKGWISWQALKMVLCSPALWSEQQTTMLLRTMQYTLWGPQIKAHIHSLLILTRILIFSNKKTAMGNIMKKANHCKEKWELCVYRETQSSRFTLMWLFLNPCVFSYRGPDNTVCVNDIPR